MPLSSLLWQELCKKIRVCRVYTCKPLTAYLYWISPASRQLFCHHQQQQQPVQPFVMQRNLYTNSNNFALLQSDIRLRRARKTCLRYFWSELAAWTITLRFGFIFGLCDILYRSRKLKVMGSRNVEWFFDECIIYFVAELSDCIHGYNLYRPKCVCISYHLPFVALQAFLLSPAGLFVFYFTIFYVHINVPDFTRSINKFCLKSLVKFLVFSSLLQTSLLQ